MNLFLSIYNHDWVIFWPTMVLIATGVFCIFVKTLYKNISPKWMCLITVLGILKACFAAWYASSTSFTHAFGHMVLQDDITRVFQPIILLTTLFITVLSEPYLKKRKIPFVEVYPLLCWASAGAMLMISTTHWLILFIGLELFSLSLYVLCGLSRQEERSEESALKYFLLGAFASAFLLYGIALLYGATGSLRMEMLPGAWNLNDDLAEKLIPIGTLFILAGMSFKLGLVPFHQWTPDVYQGAPTNITAYMSVIGKVGSIGMLLRLLQHTLFLKEFLWPVLVGMTVLSIVIANLLALKQTDIKRLLAYSSIANGGYMMVGVLAMYRMHLSANELMLTDALTNYLSFYAVMTLFVFSILIILASFQGESEEIYNLRGLWKRMPVAGILFFIAWITLAGIPPFIGFFAKIGILQIALQAELLGLAVVMLLGSLIGAAYYFRVAQLAYTQD